jgi:GNAT superfamily N-acetyltransferase
MKSNHQTFFIRKAEQADVSLILHFIKELAEYEKLSHEVVATEADLERYLFGDEKVAEVLIGYEGELPVGFALFFHNFSTFLGKPGIYLEDLVVLEEHRGKGYGTKLLVRLAVLDWNEPSIEFYKSLVARMMNEWIVNRMSGESLVKLAAKF